MKTIRLLLTLFRRRSPVTTGTKLLAVHVLNCSARSALQ